MVANAIYSVTISNEFKLISDSKRVSLNPYLETSAS